jgi:hypothetical protein
LYRTVELVPLPLKKDWMTDKYLAGMFSYRHQPVVLKKSIETNTAINVFCADELMDQLVQQCISFQPPQNLEIKQRHPGQGAQQILQSLAI